MNYYDFDKRKHTGLGRKPAEDLKRDGWCSFDFHDLPIEPWLFEQFPDFFRICAADLLPDPYDRSGLRYRRFAKFVYQPDNDLLVPFGREVDSLGAPKVALIQGSEYQPEHGDERRMLPAIIEPVVTSPLLKALILADLRVGLWSGVVPLSPVYQVSVHIQSLEPRGNAEAVITPNLSHRDGEITTFVHMLRRFNVEGGGNGVTTLEGVGFSPRQIPEKELLAEFDLEEIGAGFAVDDRRVGHYVEGVKLVDPTKFGCRTTMLIDFCPSRWVYSNEL